MPVNAETRIIVADIPDEGLFLNYQGLEGFLVELDSDKRLVQGEGRLEITRTGQDVHVEGWVRAVVKLRCDRCLEDFDLQIETDFFYLLKSPEEFRQELLPEQEVTEENVEEYWYEDGQIRADDLFREQILLKLPVRNLCRQSCKGLCPGCGADLNREKCRCPEPESDSPFAVLKGLLAT